MTCPNSPGPTTRKSLGLVLLGDRVSVEGVGHRQIVAVAPGGAGQPVPEPHGFVVVAEALQCQGHHAAVSQPGVAVVPVAGPPIRSGSEVVGAATSAEVGWWCSSFSARALRTTTSRLMPGRLQRPIQSRHRRAVVSRAVRACVATSATGADVRTITMRWPWPSTASSVACLLYTSPSPRDGLLSR